VRWYRQTGLTGPTGPTGATGATGATGSTGPTGATPILPVGAGALIPFASGLVSTETALGLLTPPLLGAIPIQFVFADGAGAPVFGLIPAVDEITQASFSTIAPRTGTISSLTAGIQLNLGLTLLTPVTQTYLFQLLRSPAPATVAGTTVVPPTYAPILSVVVTLAIPAGLTLGTLLVNSNTAPGPVAVTIGDRLTLQFVLLSTTTLPIGLTIGGLALEGAAVYI